jgi:membrane-bound lytic murein transglycosylase MltF
LPLARHLRELRKPGGFTVMLLKARPVTGLATCSVLVLALIAAPAACQRADTTQMGERGSAVPATGAGQATRSGSAVTSLLDVGTSEVLGLTTPWKGDFDEVADGRRRFIRVLVPVSRTFYYVDGDAQEGIAFDSLREFEQTVTKGSGPSAVKPQIVIIPMTRDRFLDALASGYGDIAIGGLTITDARSAKVQFSIPTMTGVRSVIVSGHGAPSIKRLDDLAGQPVQVRRSSSYHEDLMALNRQFVAQGRKPIDIQAADEQLEDEDLLQMADAGIIPFTVAKDFIATFWAQLYDQVQVHPELAIRTDGELAWALREGAPEFKKVVDDFVRTHRAGTLFGNMMLKRYLGSVERLKNPTAEADRERFRTTMSIFEKYGKQYDLDWVLISAQAYQESRLNQDARNSVGAIGVMQIKPETAGQMGVDDIERIDNNVHAGVKYLRFMIDRYFKSEPIDELNRVAFALASYNAGPAKVQELRQKAAQAGLNADVWFANVELVASRDIGRQTVDYVSNIYKYYIAYKSIVTEAQRRDLIRRQKQG